jgi:hypothetical protein
VIDQDIKEKMHGAFVAMSNGDTEAAIATVAELAGEALTHMAPADRRPRKAGHARRGPLPAT